MQFGGFGIAASTPFTGCIDDSNQQYIEITHEDTGILKFSGIQVNYTLIDYRLGQIKFFSIYSFMQESALSKKPADQYVQSRCSKMSA